MSGLKYSKIYTNNLSSRSMNTFQTIFQTSMEVNSLIHFITNTFYLSNKLETWQLS